MEHLREDLRARAEAELASELDRESELYELRVHQVELLMQNDELRRVEQELTSSRDIYRRAYLDAPIGLLRLEASGVCHEVNSTAAALLNTDRDELLTRPLQRHLSEEMADRLTLHLRDLFAGRGGRGLELIVGDRSDAGAGQRLYLHTVARSGRCHGVLIDLADPISREAVLAARERELAVRTRALAAREAVLAAREREAAQREPLELYEPDDKLAALGRLAAGVAHELNNVLCVVPLELALLQEDGVETEVSVDAISQAIDRATNLTRELQLFAYQRPYVGCRPVDVAQVMRELELVAARELGNGTTLSLSAPEEPMWVRAQRDDLERVLLNLLLNARDISPGEPLSIVAGEVELDEDGASRVSGGRPGRFVHLTVCDVGDNFDREQLAHLFEPFYATNKLARGDGMRMAVCYGIVTAAGGFFDVESSGEGNALAVYLPLEAPEPSEGATAPKLGGRGETILVVDDQPLLRRSLSRMLNNAGYDVREATGGQEALAILEQPRHDIALVISDIVMPDIDGIEVAREIAGRDPELPVILMSGYTERDLAEDARFISKPFNRPSVLRLIRDALGETD